MPIGELAEDPADQTRLSPVPGGRGDVAVGGHLAGLESDEHIEHLSDAPVGHPTMAVASRRPNRLSTVKPTEVPTSIVRVPSASSPM